MKRPGPESIQNVESGAGQTGDLPEKKPSWQAKAECRDEDINQLFGDTIEVGKDTVERQQRLARTVLCDSCEVDLECLEAAKREEKLGDPEVGVYGLRGGMTEFERRKYYRRLRRAKNRRRRRRNIA